MNSLQSIVHSPQLCCSTPLRYGLGLWTLDSGQETR
jgi:hypothetical protein